MRVTRLLEERSPAVIVVVGVVVTFLLGEIDYWTGWELSFSVFYLLPVSMVAWYAGRWPGLGTALLSALVWALANHLAGQRNEGLFLAVWNAVVRLGFFVVVVLALAALRRTLQALRQALDREQVLARLDGVTGVRNARAFYELVQREVARAERYGNAITIAYLDADGFKAVNDAFGHSVGDRILRTIGATLERMVRESDVVARLGGDEFAVLFPETGPDVAEFALKKLQGGLGEAMAREGVAVTFCIGAVTTRSPRRPVDELIKRADTLMFEVKRAGKNGIKLERLPDG